MKRPLFRTRVSQLEGIFSKKNETLQVLKRLLGELRCRKTHKAAVLRVKVIAMMAALGCELSYKKEPNGVVLEEEQAGAVLREVIDSPQTSILPPELVAHGYEPKSQQWDQTMRLKVSQEENSDDLDSSPLPELMKPPVSHSEIATSTAENSINDSLLDNACKVLRITPGVEWKRVELARRQLVQHASPARTASMSPEKKLRLQEQAQCANLACISIWKSRISQIN